MKKRLLSILLCFLVVISLTVPAFASEESTIDITQSDLDTINELIAENDTWSLTNNCSSFAVKIWNAVSTIQLSAGLINTPNNLIDSIKSQSGYQTNRAVNFFYPIGYMSNGTFHSVSVSSISVSAEAGFIAVDTGLPAETLDYSPILREDNYYE